MGLAMVLFAWGGVIAALLHGNIEWAAIAMALAFSATANVRLDDLEKG